MEDYRRPHSGATPKIAHAPATINVNRDRVDLSGDNELPDLLAERERLAFFAKQIEAEQAQNRRRIAEKMGDASYCTLPGWKLRRFTRYRKGYTVKAMCVSYIVAQRVKTAEPGHTGYDFS
jgi:hypothetical protein